MLPRNGVGRHREAFDKEWDDIHKKSERVFGVALILSIVWTIVILGIICLAGYLAWKQWG